MHLWFKQLNEVKELFNTSKEEYNELNSIMMKKESFLRYQDILRLLEIRGYVLITDISTLSGTSYLIFKMVDFDEFEIRLKSEIKKKTEEKRMDYSNSKCCYWYSNRFDSYIYKFTN